MEEVEWLNLQLKILIHPNKKRFKCRQLYFKQKSWFMCFEDARLQGPHNICSVEGPKFEIEVRKYFEQFRTSLLLLVQKTID